ncbi:MAG: response regulator transcription factor [Marinilabiliales bacterium]
MSVIKILLLDDHEIVRDGLKALLIGEPEIKVIGEAGNDVEFFNLLEKQKPDVVILDIELPGKSGIEVAAVLEEKNPEIHKLILSANLDETNIASAINYNVLGILPKSVNRDEFIQAIKTVYKGDQFYSEIIIDLFIKSYVDINKLSKKYQINTKTNILSEREIEVIRCFAEGMIYKEIADKLNISPRTVESHKVNILKKLKLNNIIDLVKFAIKNHIVSL